MMIIIIFFEDITIYFFTKVTWYSIVKMCNIKIIIKLLMHRCEKLNEFDTIQNNSKYMGNLYN